MPNQLHWLTNLATARVRAFRAVGVTKTRLAVATLLAIQALLAGCLAVRYSPTVDEVGHFGSGVYTWNAGSFDVYCVNPPLVRTVATAPAAIAGLDFDWDEWASGPHARPEWNLGRSVFRLNGARAIQWLIVGRWLCIPFLLTGAYICFRWASELYGVQAGFLALGLWSFSPTLLGNGSLITPDAAAASAGVLAGYTFWQWLRQPCGLRALGAALALGLAQLTKMSWLILFGLWPGLWLVWIARSPQNAARLPRQAAQLAAILLAALCFLNAGYGFEGTLKRLGDYQFVSSALAGDEKTAKPGNRFVGTILAELPVPVPQPYLRGLDLQKRDFETGAWCYLHGEWRRRGCWYWYLYAALVKVPLGTWGLGILAAWQTIGDRRARLVPQQRCQASLCDELVLLAPALTLLAVASSQTGLMIYFRYVLPCLPFVFIWTGKCARALFDRWKWASVCCVFLGAWSISSSLAVYPHSLSYFNLAAGGPENGHEHLLDANMDWGQDTFVFRDWLRKHPGARPMHFQPRTQISPEHYGLKLLPVPNAIPQGADASRLPPTILKKHGPQPGWHAISVHELHNRNGRYGYLLEHFQPAATAGYSIYIYHITLDEANRVRREVGLPEIEE